MRQAETNRFLQSFHQVPLVLLKATHPHQNLKRNLKLPLSFANLLLMIWSWQQETSDQKVFLVKEVLVAYSKGGSKRMGLHLWNRGQDLLLQWKPSIMMGFRVIKNGWFDAFKSFCPSFVLCCIPVLCILKYHLIGRLKWIFWVTLSIQIWLNWLATASKKIKDC